jgi:hypothetical protein
LKKPTGSVRFRFYKPKTEKTEPNRTQTEKTRKKTEPNWYEQVFVLKKLNRTETGRFEPVLVFFLKIFGLVTFFYKNRTEPKMITPKIYPNRVDHNFIGLV